MTPLDCEISSSSPSGLHWLGIIPSGVGAVGVREWIASEAPCWPGFSAPFPRSCGAPAKHLGLVGSVPVSHTEVGHLRVCWCRELEGGLSLNWKLLCNSLCGSDWEQVFPWPVPITLLLRPLSHKMRAWMPSSGFPFIGVQSCPVGRVLVSWRVTSEGQIRHNCSWASLSGLWLTVLCRSMPGPELCSPWE